MHIYLGLLCVLGRLTFYHFIIGLSMVILFALKFTLSDINIANHVFFINICMIKLLYILLLSIYLCHYIWSVCFFIYIKWAMFLIHSVTSYVLMAVFRLLIFNVSTDMLGLKSTILVFVFCLISFYLFFLLSGGLLKYFLEFSLH